jgi:serine/threonine-protein kinase
MPSLAGQQLDKYDMLEEVGHGGMAVVYRSKDTVLDREVAVKVLHPHLADREESRARLRREAITVAKLRHDNILEIFDYSGEGADESYIVTEFIHGVTLRDWLDTRWQPRPALAAMIVHRLCLALAHAHEFGVVHRDIKPENVMIREDGCLKLMDFGIAQILDHQKLTLTGQLLGSPAYMAPELISGKPIDARTDLFAVGILLYQLSTGQLPFSGRNPHEVLNRIADADYAPASTVNPMVDEDLEDILKRALAREPDHRFQTARAFANELEDYVNGMGIEPSPEELRAYFKNAEQYVDELDQRVCEHLLEKAQKANTEGHGARALKLLSRVIELDPQNSRAKEMIDAVRRRGRVMRQVLLGVGVVALLGMIGAGVMLMRELGDREAQAQASGKVAKAKTKGPTPPTKEDEPPVPRVVEPEVSETGGVEPPVEGGTTGGPAIAADDGETGDGGRNGSGGKKPARLPRTEPCEVTITALPVTMRKRFSIKVGRSGAKQPLDKDGKATVDIPLKGGGTIFLDGPDKYNGAWTRTVGDCAGGKLSLEARPEPATIKFRDLPPDLQGENVVVECLSGCKQKTGPVLWQKFEVKLKPGDEAVQVKVNLKSAYGVVEQTWMLSPGVNPVDGGFKK